MNEHSKANVGIEFGAIFRLISDKMYRSSAVFLRENVQNAIDALRLLPTKGVHLQEQERKIVVTIERDRIEVQDNGIGMSRQDLQTYYWTVGCSSKNNEEARRHGVIGKFGIGAFANFGVCNMLEVHTMGVGELAIYSRVERAALDNGQTSYSIQRSNRLSQRGTLIIGILNKEIDKQEVMKYLQMHVRYIPEYIYVNGNLVSTEHFPEYPLSQGQDLGTLMIALGTDTATASITIGYHQGNPVILLGITTSGDSAHGRLFVENGQLEIYSNKFLISDNVSRFTPRTIPFSGYLNTSILRPNVTREGLEAESEIVISRFIEDLSNKLVEFLGERGMLFDHPATARHVRSLSRDLKKKYLPDILVRTYGEKSRKRLRDVIETAKAERRQIFFTTVDEPPLEIASASSDQSVIVILLGDLERDLQIAVQQYLESEISATEISEFELGARFLEEAEITPTQKAIRTTMRKILRDSYAVTDMEIHLCEFAETAHVILRKTEKSTSALINVSSPIVKEAEAYAYDGNMFNVLINNVLIQQYLGRFLIQHLPSDTQAIIARWEQKPRTMTYKKISLINLIKGSGTWAGPDTDCIEIKSVFFKNLEGCYLRLPEHAGDALRPYLAGASHGTYIWVLKMLFVIFSIGDGKSIVLNIQCESSIEYRGQLNGRVEGKRRPLIYQSGVFWEVPKPHLSRLLPADHRGSVTLEYTFLLEGFENVTQKEYKRLQTLGFKV